MYFLLNVLKQKNYLLFFFYLFFIIKPNISNSYEKINTIKIFEKKIEIATKVSFSQNNKINWLSEFEKISQDNNKSIYKLENEQIKIIRIVTKYKNYVIINDYYTNKTSETIGIITNYEFLKFPINSIKISGSKIEESNQIIAENPSILFNDREVSMGIYINDEFSKIHSQINVNNDNYLNIYTKNLIIKPKDEYIKSFTIYKFNKVISYYEFINYLRKELNVYSYIDGNLFWLDTYLNREILNDETRLKNFLKNYGIKYLIVTPWLDYDNYDHLKNKKWSRIEFKEHLIKIKKIINEIDPKIKLIVALQSNVVSIDDKIQKIIRENKSNKIQEGFNHYNIGVDELINLGFKKEELVYDQNNRILFETYYEDWNYYNTKNIPEIALALKAISNGHLYNKLVEQINFVIDEIQFDGIYIDQFNQHYISPKHRISFEGQNVNIGQIDDKTGRVVKMTENVTLNTIEFQEKIINQALTKTNVIFLNSHPFIDNLKKKQVINFFEGFWYFWAKKTWEKNSTEFFTAKTFFSSHLSTPVALSLSHIQKGDWELNPHSTLVKNLRFCLYNGNLMYILAQDIQKLNIEKNKINVFSKLYPIEVDKINQGTIIGKKKIISIVDVIISKEKYHDYNFFYFDENGYIINNKIKKITETQDNFVIHLDKNEILIAEMK
jgi:hypothetical protein